MKKSFPFLVFIIFFQFACPRSTDNREVTDDSSILTGKSETSDNFAFPPYKGSQNPKVLIITFGDFQCPHTANMEIVLQKIHEKFESDVAFIFHQLPLPIHKFAHVAAIASLAALKQGKFWEFHDGLFRLQRENRFNLNEINSLAKTLNLDPVRFKNDFQGKEIAELMDTEKKLAHALHVEASPTIFVNGRMLVGIQTYDNLLETVYKEIGRINEAMSKGLSLKDAYEIIAEATNPLYGKYILKGEKLPEIEPERNIRISDEVYAVSVKDNDPSLGPRDALVTIVEFGNYRCPWCRKSENIIRELLKQYPEDLLWVFKQNPLSMYPDSMIAAKAALSAHAQGKFLQMHELLMKFETEYNLDAVEKMAVEAGLNVKEFMHALNSDGVRTLIEEDMDLAVNVTAKGTPNFFINGRKITGLIPIEDFKFVIEGEIKKAKDLLAQGVDKKDIYSRIIQNGIKIIPISSERKEINTINAPSIGKKDAVYHLVIFSDFASPVSKRVSDSIKELMKEYGNKMSLHFKHYPLDVHKEALLSSIASMCANEQRKFFEYHDMLFQNQNDLGFSALQNYAGKINLDLSKFNQCIKEEKYKNIIIDDIKEGQSLNIRTIPALFINGRQFIPAIGWEAENIKRAIERYIK